MRAGTGVPNRCVAAAPAAGRAIARAGRSPSHDSSEVVEGTSMHANTLLVDRVNRVPGEGGAGAVSTRTALLPNRAQCRCAWELAICGCRALWMMVMPSG